MENGLNANVINGGIVILGGVLVLLTTGGIVAGLMAFYNYLKSRKAEVERAYQALPPDQQAKLNKAVESYNVAIKTVQEIVATLVQLGQLGTDLTDNDPNTPADPPSLFAAADKLEAKAKALRTAAINVQSLANAAPKTIYPPGWEPESIDRG